MSEKVRIQLGYDPTDETTQRAVIMLESAMRSKSQLVALALCEFADKYGFRIDNTEEIKTVIKNYDYLSRAMDMAVPTERVLAPSTPTPTYQRTEKPKKPERQTEKAKSNKMLLYEEPSAKEEVAEEIPASDTPKAVDLGLEEDIVVSEKAMMSMNNVLAMFSQG